MERKKAKVVITSLVVLVLGLVVGYAALSTTLNINGTAAITSDWNVHIETIVETTATNATTVNVGKTDQTTATFTTDLEKPGSSAVYTVTVKNSGNQNAVLKSIGGLTEANAAQPTDIKYTVEGIAANDTLDAGASKTFTVKVEWLTSSTAIPTTSSKTLTLALNYEQA